MYEQVLLFLSKETGFRSSEPFPSPRSERRNPACGDEVALKWELEERTLRNLTYYAQACAISVASSNVMCRELEGVDVEEALERIGQVMSFLDSDGDWTEDWGQEAMPALGAVRAKPMRLTCVRLPWEALREGLGTV